MLTIRAFFPKRNHLKVDYPLGFISKKMNYLISKVSNSLNHYLHYYTNNMNKYITPFLLATLILSSCHSPSSEIIITEFPEKVKLSAKTIKTKPIILAPKEMFIINDRLWIFQNQKDTIFDVFHLPDGEYLYSTGTKGKGPNEFISPRFIQKMNNGFSILDNTEVRITEIADNGLLKTIESYRPFNIFPINGFVRLNDSLVCAFAYCATGMKGKYEYRMANRFTEKEKVFSLYPNLTSKEYEGDQRCQIYYKYLASNPQTSQIAAFYTYFKYIRFYNYDGSLEKEIHVNITPYESVNIENQEERMMYYVKVVSTERFIYALCLNTQGDDDISMLEIQVWDWNGTPIIQYALDRTFDTYTISEENKKLYTAFEENEDEIYMYDLVHLK